MKCNLTVIILLLTLNFITVSFGQEIDLSQFYYSSFEPKELNLNSADKLKEIYAEYREKNKGVIGLNEEKFVYEYNYFLDRLNKSGKIYYGDEISNYLNRLKNLIIEDTTLSKNIHVYMVDYPNINAFTNDFGNIYVNLASVAKLNSEEEMLFLLGHEISHILLKHSQKTEINNNKLNKKEWNKEEGLDNKFLKHAFSRENELQADSLAFELLKNKVSEKYCHSLFNQLVNEANPIYKGPIDISLLCGNDSLMINHMKQLWDFHQNDTLFFKLKQSESDSLSTHPSIDKRVNRFAELSRMQQGTRNDHLSLENYSRYKKIASYLLVNTYRENSMLIEALQLVLKLREENPSDTFLIKNQVRIMTLFNNAKYTATQFDQLLNDAGNSCNDLDYLKFKKILLAMHRLDFNILAINTTNQYSNLSKSVNETCNSANNHNLLLLYKNNPSVFIDPIDSLGYQFTSWNENIKIQYDTIQLQKMERIVMDTLVRYGYQLVKESDSTRFLKSFLATIKLSEKEQRAIAQYIKTKKEKKWEAAEGTGNIFIHPALAAQKYNRGIFQKSSQFDPKLKSILFQTDNMYFVSNDKRKFKVDYMKTLDLEKKMIEIYKRYENYSGDYSNISGKTVSVFDNYLHKIIWIWMQENSGGNDLSYSVVNDEIQTYLSQKDVSYLVYNLCIVNRNWGVGKRYYMNYYEIFFDIKNFEVSYISKIGSKQTYDKYQLEQMVYLSSKNKTKK